MRYALPGSALVHACILGAALFGFVSPEAEDAPAPAPVRVSIVALSTVTSNSTEVLESDASVSAVSAGSVAETVEPLPSQPVPTVEPATSEPIVPQQVDRVEPDTVDATETPPPPEAVAPLEASEIVELAADTIEPLQTASIEPVAVEDLKVPPVPRMLSFQRPSTPTPRAEIHQRRQPRPQAAPSRRGSGGENQADAVASAGSAAASGQGSGGEAEVARYPGMVIGELRRALRRTGSTRGEVIVRFTVSANGQLAAASIATSSGNDAIDSAGLATVQRAAPFPPIPPAAGRSTWTFDVPLAFGG